MANKSFPDFAGNPDTVLTTPAPTDQVLIWDNSEPLDINKVKVITFQNLVNLAAQSAIQALVSGQAAGDTFYATSATALARVAKGTAGQVKRMNAGATAPEWGSPLSCYGSFSVPSTSSLTATSWTDLSTATVDITVPCTSTLVAFASMDGYHQTDGHSYLRWMLDGTEQPLTSIEYHVGGVSHPISLLGIKTGVVAGTKTCKLQYYVSNNGLTANHILGIVLGFAQ